MKRMIFLYILVFIPILLFACGKKEQKRERIPKKEIVYVDYRNDRYEFYIIFPQYYDKQDESTSGDGITLATEDDTEKLLIYYDLWLSIGDFPTIQEAFEEAKNGLELTSEELNEDHFVLKGITGDGEIFERWTAKRGSHYITIYHTGQDERYKMKQEIINAMLESLVVGSEEGKETAFLYDFIDNCYNGKNFYYEVLHPGPELERFIDPDMDVRRVYSPGSLPNIYTRSENFGFDETIDFHTKQFDIPEYVIQELGDIHPCDLEYSATACDGLFVQYDTELPTGGKYIEEQDEIVTVTIDTPYPNAPTVALFAPLYEKGFYSLIAFYFIKTPKGWMLAAFDESWCSA
ncbi:MAG: hypothetical protein Q4D93_05615 [Porphyromonas sp.]|nr:hypothetical protein [Porphyromonas sp.]